MSEILTSSTIADFDTAPLKAAIESEDKAVSEIVQKLIRGELSALETYDQVIETFQGKIEASLLTGIRDEHASTLSSLEKFAEGLGATPEETSGAWGSWAQFTTGAAKMFGEKAAIQALIEGEEHGLKTYKAVVDDADTDVKLSEQIQNQLIFKQMKHIDKLKEMVESQRSLLT